MKASPRVLASLAAATAGVLLYLPGLRNGWAQDSPVVIRDNPVLHDLDNLRLILWGPYWPGMADCWRPLTLLSFAIDWHLWGDNALWYHAQNIIWHAGASGLLVLLLIRLGAAPTLAGLGGVLFAVHPVHVEAVASIVGRSDLMVSAMYLAACLLYLNRGVDRESRSVGVIVLFATAIATKEMAITLPAVLLLLDFWDRAPTPAGERLRAALRDGWPALVGIVGVAAIYLVCRSMVLGADNLLTYGAPYLVRQGDAARLATAARLIPELGRLLLWPADLSVEWGPGAINVASWREPLPYVGALLLAGAAGWAALRWRERSWTALAAAWILITYSPVSHALFPVGLMIGERTLYLVSVGVVMLLPAAAAVMQRRPRWARGATVAVFGVLLSAAAWRSSTRIPTWKSAETLLATLMTEHPETYRSTWEEAKIAMDQGRVDDAIVYYEKTLALSDLWAPPGTDYATRMIAANRPEQAESVLRRVTAAHPELPRPHQLLASTLILQRKWRPALDVLESGRTAFMTLELRAGADHLAALALDGLGQTDSALIRRLAAAQFPPRQLASPHWMHLARLQQLGGRRAEAQESLATARRLAPEWLRPRLTLEPLPSVTAFFVLGFGPVPAEANPPPPRDSAGVAAARAPS